MMIRKWPLVSFVTFTHLLCLLLVGDMKEKKEKVTKVIVHDVTFKEELFSEELDMNSPLPSCLEEPFVEEVPAAVEIEEIAEEKPQAEEAVEEVVKAPEPVIEKSLPPPPPPPKIEKPLPPKPVIKPVKKEEKKPPKKEKTPPKKVVETPQKKKEPPKAPPKPTVKKAKTDTKSVKKDASKKVADKPKPAVKKVDSSSTAKKTTGNPSQNKADPALLALMQESLNTLNKGGKKGSGGGSSTVAPKAIQTLASEGIKESAPLRTYREELALYLKRRLHLPEHGDVKMQLTLTKEGKVADLKIVSTASEKNREYVLKMVPTFSFPPPLEALSAGEKTHMFPLTLKSD